MNLTSNRSAHRPDSNCENDTPIWVQMKKIEPVKIGLNFDDLVGNEGVIWTFYGTWNPANSIQILGIIVASLRGLLRSKTRFSKMSWLFWYNKKILKKVLWATNPATPKINNKQRRGKPQPLAPLPTMELNINVGGTGNDDGTSIATIEPPNYQRWVGWLVGHERIQNLQHRNHKWRRCTTKKLQRWVWWVGCPR